MDNDIKIESKKKNRNYKTKMQENKEHNEYNELSKEITVRKQKTKLNFVKTHQQKNNQDADPEKALSMAKSFVFDKNVASQNPYFNKKN